jgi:CheY-like chemotaxis protein
MTRVLIVEDERIVAAAMQRCLERAGCAVTFVTDSGVEALDSIPRQRPDVVVVDLRLPGDMDGLETAERIHQLYRMPIVLVTAFGDPEVVQRAEGIPGCSLLHKPFPLDRLQQAVWAAAAAGNLGDPSSPGASE